MDARRLRPRPAEPGPLIPLRLGAQRASAGPLIEVGGEVRTIPDARARVTVRGNVLDASWPDGVRARLRAAADGRGWRLDCSVSSSRAVTVGAVGVRILGLAATRMLADGYHSWDWAGVRDAAAGRGWWGGVWGTPGGAQTAISLLAPPRLGPLLLRWNNGESVGALTVGAPRQLTHATDAPPLLGVALAPGATLRGDAIRIAPLDPRSQWGCGVPRLDESDRRPAPRTGGWMSWNCLGSAVGAADVVDAARTLVPPGGLALLDDGWMQRWGDWQERDDFDSTVADLAAAVHAGGRRFGLWLAPFLVDPESHAVAAEGARMLLRDDAGAPVVSVRGPRPHLVLDASRRATRAHLAALGRRLGRLGVDALKLDFLFAGVLPGARDGMSDIAALRAGVAALVRAYRAAAPRGSRVFACGAPAPPLVGLVDACRSGDDSVANIPSALAATPPLHPWFVHGEAVLRAQARNLQARAWLWGATVPPDADAVTLGPVGDTPAPGDGYVQAWLELARRSGGPLLDADTPAGRLDPARTRRLRRAQQAVMGTAARPTRPRDPLTGSAVADDEAGFLSWPDELPDELPLVST